MKLKHSPLTLLRTVFVFVSSFSSSLRLMLKNIFILCICCCMRQQPHDAWSVRHTEHTHTHTESQNHSRLQIGCRHTDYVLCLDLSCQNSLTIFCVGIDIFRVFARSSPGIIVSLDEGRFQQAQQYNSWREEEQRH